MCNLNNDSEGEMYKHSKLNIPQFLYLGTIFPELTVVLKAGSFNLEYYFLNHNRHHARRKRFVQLISFVAYVL